MEIKILETFENAPLNRREYLLHVTHPGEPSPSRKELREKLTEEFGKNFIIKKEDSDFGFGRSKVLVFSYDSEEALKETEPKYLFKREGLMEGKQ